MKIICNKIRCKHCGDVIESTHTHDFKWCKCGTVAVDGGHEYLKRSFQSNDPNDDFEDLSITLKPCPFCGEEAGISEYQGLYKVICLNAKCFVHPETPYVDESRAIEIWNRRSKQ